MSEEEVVYEMGRQATIRGDHMGKVVMADAAFEIPEQGSIYPYQVGKSYLFHTVSLFYVGKVVSQGPGWVMINDTSWIHWTGRYSTLIQHGFDPSKFPEGDNTPRTEFIGDGVIVHVGSQGAATVPWRHALPKVSIV